MNVKQNIERLWNHLKIQDEVLIVPVYNLSNHTIEYAMAEIISGSLQVRIAEHFDAESFDRPYRLVKYRNEYGMFEIPSVDKIEQDCLMDY